MNESQFIVPPTKGEGDNSAAPVKAPFKVPAPAPMQNPTQPILKSAVSGSSFSKATNWVSSHKALTGSLGGAIAIIVLVATVMVTRQPVSLFGYQLNPMVPHAQVPAPCDPIDPDCEPIGGGGGGGPVVTVDVPSVLLIIGDSNSSSPNLPSSCDTETNGPSTVVSVRGAADCLKVNISNPKATYSKDFRICFSLDATGEQCTPWASAGGGSTQEIRSGGSFSTAGVRVESQDLPAGKQISGVEVGVQVFYQKNNDPCGQTSGLNWAKAVTGQNTSNPWSFGAAQDDDPGCALMSLRAQLTDVNSANNIAVEGLLPNGTVGVQLSQTLTLSGTVSNPCTWTLVSVAPPIIGASLLGAEGPGLTATFKATPTSAGTYQVSVKATCQNGQIATKTLPWIVVAAPVASDLSITGSFPDGKVAQAYTTNVSTVNAGGANCTLTLVKVTPAVAGATLVRVDNVTGSPETSAMFSATPVSAGSYVVSTEASCAPLMGDGPTRTATKDFNWTVTSGPSTPGAISLSGTFPNGNVGQLFNTSIVTSGTANLPCTWTLVSVVPSIASAKLTVSVINGTPNQASTGFEATPTEAGAFQITIRANCQNGQTATKTFSWTVTGITPPPPTEANCATPANIPFLTAIYRLWSPAKGDHLYTTNANEKPSGYRAEGIAGYVYNKQVTGTVAIYRSNQAQIGAHYYSTTNDASNYGYSDEGILGYTFANSVTGSAPWYRMHKGGAASDYVHTVSEEERTAIKELGYVDEGVVAQLCGTPQPTALQPIYRMWNGAVKEHFYTTNPAERDALLVKGFTSEGITGYMFGVRKEGSSPVYRSYHKIEKHHYFSLTESEATGWGYTVEGIIGYIWPTTKANTIPLYKLFNSKTRDNLYTASNDEVNSAVASGYENQGILGYMFLTAQ